MSVENCYRKRILIYHDDVDVNGIVHHIHYLRYFENARSDWLRSVGVKQTALMAKKVYFVVRKAELTFHAPARFEDELEIVTTIVAWKKTNLVFEQSILNTANNQLICVASVQVVSINEQFKPCSVPVELEQLR